MTKTEGEATEGKTMGSVMPVLFLAIAILTMVTTMHRIATKEKIQIGTLKALGFTEKDIPWLTENCMKVSAGNLANTPVTVDADMISRIYKAAM